MKTSFKPNKLGKIVLVLASIIIVFFLVKNRKNLKREGNKTIKANRLSKVKTWDSFTDAKIDTLHPNIQAKVKELINIADKKYNIKLRVTSALRTWEEQTKLYNKGRSSPGNIVTKAKAGQSYHNYGLAFDVVEIKNNKALWKNTNWSKIGAIGKSLGFVWGGDWKFTDKPHFQMAFGKNYTQLAQLYNEGKRNGHYVVLT